MTIRPAGLFGQFMMVAFWVLAFAWGPGRLTATYLILTVLALVLISRSKRIAFQNLIGNNNWVFCSTLSMALLSMLIAIKNPYIPQNLWEKLADVPYDPLAEYTVLGTLNDFCFGETFTDGWKSSAWIYFFLTIIAIFVSFSDDLLAHLKEEGQSWHSILHGLARRR